MKPISLLVFLSLLQYSLWAQGLTVNVNKADLTPQSQFGYINLNITGGTPPYTITWDDGPTTKNREYLAVGTYDYQIEDDNGALLDGSVEIGHQVIWRNLINLEVDGNSVIKPNAGGWGTAGMSSINKLEAGTDGFVSFVCNNVNEQFMLGLGKKDQTPIYGDITYRFYLYNRQLRVTAYPQSSTNVLAHVNVGDVIKVERIGNTINFKINENIIYSYTNSNVSTHSLIVDSSIYWQRDMDWEVNTSFGYPTQPAAPGYAKLQPNLEGGHVEPHDDLLKFQFVQDYPVDNQGLPFKIYGGDLGNQAVTGSLPATAIGINRLELDLSSQPLATGKSYILEMVANKGTKYYLKFNY